jgi:hypothetical protein
MLGIVAVSYEVFIDGTRIGAAGNVGGASQPFNRPHSFSIPAGVLRPGKPVTIALRVWNPQLGWNVGWELPDSGPYMLTNSWHAKDASANWSRISTALTPAAVMAVAQVFLAIFTLSFWLALSRGRELLWLGGYLLFLGVCAGNSKPQNVLNTSARAATDVIDSAGLRRETAR